MAGLGTLKMPVSKATKNCTLNLKLTGMRTFRFRMWIVLRLLKLVGIICPIEVQLDTKE